MLGEITACLWAGGNDPGEREKTATWEGQRRLSLSRKGGGGGTPAQLHRWEGGLRQKHSQFIPSNGAQSVGADAGRGKCSKAHTEVIVEVLLFSQ